jgi:hypothetical protein
MIHSSTFYQKAAVGPMRAAATLSESTYYYMLAMIIISLKPKRIW